MRCKAADETTEREKSVSTSSARRPRTSPSATPTAPVAKGRVMLQGALIEIDERSGRALAIRRVSEMLP